MQELSRRTPSAWPSALHFTVDDFEFIFNVVTVSQPFQNVTNALSSSSSWVGDVIPLMTSAIDNVQHMEVTMQASRLQKAVVTALTVRAQMLLDTEAKHPFSGVN